MENEVPTPKPISVPMGKAMHEPCPYCGKLFAMRSQLLIMVASEQHDGEPEGIRDRDFHPEMPPERDQFRALVCMGCGFTKFFRIVQS